MVSRRMRRSPSLSFFLVLESRELNDFQLEAGRIGLRLESGHNAWKLSPKPDISKPSSLGSRSWCSIYSDTCFSFKFPTVTTKYPLAHKCCPQYLFLRWLNSCNTLRLDFPLMYWTSFEIDIRGGAERKRWMWSLAIFHTSPLYLKLSP